METGINYFYLEMKKDETTVKLQIYLQAIKYHLTFLTVSEINKFNKKEPGM